MESVCKSEFVSSKFKSELFRYGLYHCIFLTCIIFSVIAYLKFSSFYSRWYFLELPSHIFLRNLRKIQVNPRESTGDGVRKACKRLYYRYKTFGTQAVMCMQSTTQLRSKPWPKSLIIINVYLSIALFTHTFHIVGTGKPGPSFRIKE